MATKQLGFASLLGYGLQKTTTRSAVVVFCKRRKEKRTKKEKKKRLTKVSRRGYTKNLWIRKSRFIHF